MEEEQRLQHIFRYYSAPEEMNGPVMRGLSYGHISDLMTIPVGARSFMEISPSGEFAFGALEPVVES
jgi:muramoyltetrapeptide carboxypeptidase